MCSGPSNLDGTDRLLLLVEQDRLSSRTVLTGPLCGCSYFSASAVGFQHHKREIQNHADGHCNHDIMVSSLG